MPQTPEEWYKLIQFAQSLIMALATVFVWFWGRERKHNQEVLRGRFHGLSTRIDQLDERLDSGNEKMSHLTSAVQTLIGRFDRLPEDFRVKFLPLDRAEDIIDESRRDRAELWKEVQKAREDLVRLAGRRSIDRR